MIVFKRRKFAVLGYFKKCLILFGIFKEDRLKTEKGFADAWPSASLAGVLIHSTMAGKCIERRWQIHSYRIYLFIYFIGIQNSSERYHIRSDHSFKEKLHIITIFIFFSKHCAILEIYPNNCFSQQNSTHLCNIKCDICHEQTEILQRQL